MNPDFRFSVALSFAGDNKRHQVREIANDLRDALDDGEEVFFDEWYEAEIAGPDGQTVLQTIYKQSSELVVTCVCERYNEKPWTQEEWRAIQSFERTLRDAGTGNVKRLRFLPVRFGDGNVDGLFDTAIVPDLRGRSNTEIVELILNRLNEYRTRKADNTSGVNQANENDVSKADSSVTARKAVAIPEPNTKFNSMKTTEQTPREVKGITSFSVDFEQFISSTEIGYSHRRKDHINLDDIFVYQYLKQLGSDFEKLDEIIRSEDCLSFDRIVQAGLTTILGTEQSGKTSLSKTLVKRFHGESKKVLWIDGSTFTTREFGRILRRALKYQCGNDTTELGEGSLNGVVVIIDNYNENKLNAKARRSLLHEFTKQGAALLLFSDNAIRFDEEQYAEISNNTVYQILLFGHELRDELIAKWTRIGAEDTITDAEQHSRIKVVADQINLVVRKGVVPSKPIYVLSIVQLLESATASDHSLTSYGHCYLNLIISGFQKAGIPQAEFDSHINLLTEFAYYMHNRGLRFASEAQLRKFCTNYESRFLGVDPNRMFSNLIQAQLLKCRCDETGFSYRFIDYFYVAKYFSEHLNSPSVLLELNSVVANLHTDRNANILIFLTHHSKDAGILNTLLGEVGKLFPERKQVTLERDAAKKLFDQLDNIPDLVEVRRTAAEERRQQLQGKDEEEGLQHDNEMAQVVDTDDYDELSQEQQNWLVQINRSLRLVEIIGQIMRNRYGSMERGQLEELANSTFEAGFKFLDLYLEALNEDEEYLVQIIEKLLSEHKKIQDSNIGTSARKFFLMLCYRACFSVISKIATSIGHEKLTRLYEEIEAKAESTEAQRLVCVAILLEHKAALPKNAIEKMANDAKSNPVVYRLLRELVIRHAYLNHIEADDRQWLQSKLGLTMEYQRTIQRNKAIRK